MPSGTRAVSKTRHSWRGGVGRLEGDGAGPPGEHDDDVGQRHVVVVRALVVPPAEVHARLLGRDTGERLVERLHVKPRHLAELRHAQIGELDVPAHRQVGAIHLEHEARPGHRLVLVLHRLRDGEQVLLVARVVVVAEEQ